MAKKLFIKFFSLFLFITTVFLIIYFNLNNSNEQLNIKTNNNNNHNNDFFIFKQIANEDVENIHKNILVNLTNFKYKLTSNICKSFKEDDLLGVIIVTSYVGHDEVRSAHRRAISQKKLSQFGFARVFLLADIPMNEKFIRQESIIDENNRFNDLIQGNFVESYHNLTYKHVMGLKYAGSECAHAKFIIKADDDTVYNIFEVHTYLLNYIYDLDDYLLAGYLIRHNKAIRIKKNKWYVSENEYKPPVYPPYLSGWLYITNPKTARALIIEAEHEPFFWIDDTYVTGILAQKLKIKHVSLNTWFSANSEFIDCCINDIQKYYIKCSYLVGPNTGDNNLIVKFIAASEKCYENMCLERTPEQLLVKTCVGQRKNLLGGHGAAVIKEIKL